MHIIDITKKYIKKYSKPNKQPQDMKDLEIYGHLLTLWASISTNELKEIFNCIINHCDPQCYSVDLLNNEMFDSNHKSIIVNVFYAYIKATQSEFNIPDSFVMLWEEAQKTYNSEPLKDDEDDDRDNTDYHLKNYINSKKTLMYKYILDSQFANKFLNNKLIVLKGWSSATPIINSYFHNNYCNGGGLYININGVGIAIDPGCNFVKNMHENGIRIFDIQYVIVTHDHIDHNDSVLSLQDLNYEYNNFVAKHLSSVLSNKKIPKNYPNKITWIVDAETKETLVKHPNFSELIKAGTEEIIINEIKTPNLEVEESEKEEQYYRASKRFLNEAETCYIDISSSTDLKCFRTHHMRNSFGIQLNSTINKQPISIGYTSDTGYFQALPNHLNNSNIVILNISELSKQDLTPDQIDKKANHLKLNGSIKTIKNISQRPQLVIVSEFWGGKDDIRLFITKKIKESLLNSTSFAGDSKKSVNVLAGDIGLTISLIDQRIVCSSCKSEMTFCEITTIQEEKYGQLRYLCNKCSD